MPVVSAGVSLDSNRYIDINPVAGWTGQTNVTIRVTDPGSLSSTDTFAVTVSALVYLPFVAKGYSPDTTPPPTPTYTPTPTSSPTPTPTPTPTSSPTPTSTLTSSPTPTPTPTPTNTNTPTTVPRPGFWLSDTGTDEFYVTVDSAYVDDFAIYISVTGCGNYKITRITPVPISNNQFSFSGSFYASGTFHSSTTASGTDGLSSFYIAGCGFVSGGPWSWSATWQNSSQPPFLPAEVVGPEIVTPMTTTGEFYKVIPIK